MATFGEVIGALIRDLVEARSSADRFSAELSRQYLKDKSLAEFPVPRIEYGEVTLTLRFAIAEVSKDLKHAEVIVQSDKLRELGEPFLSSVTIVTSMKNYAWVRSDLDGKTATLVEID